MGIRILLADDHKIFRDGLRPLLEKLPGAEVVGEAQDGQEAVAHARELSPDVVIMDISMPGLNGIEATRQILAGRPETRVVVLSMHADRRYVLETLRAGAKGYLLKDCAFDELALAIEQVVAGEIHLARQISDGVIQDYIRMARQGQDGAFSRLSPREREVLQLIAEGETTKAIADRLCLSVKTIESHRRQLMDKFDLHSVAELTKYAIRAVLTSLD